MHAVLRGEGSDEIEGVCADLSIKNQCGTREGIATDFLVSR